MKVEDQSFSKESKKFTVTEVHEKKKGYINPVIVNFQNGELNQNLSQFKVSFTPEPDGRTNIEVRTSYDQVFKDSDFRNKIQPKQILAIRNKKTNKVKIVEVDSAVLINSVLLASKEETTVKTDNTKQIGALHKTFGGKKLAARLEQKEKLNLTLAPVEDVVKKVVEDIVVEKNISINETEEESIAHLLPPCHRDVKNITDIYNLYELLTNEELQSLKNGLEKLEESEKGFKQCSQFFIEHYAQAKKSQTNLEDRLAGLLFTEYLIRFLKIPSKQIVSKLLQFSPFLPEVNEKLMNEFCIRTEAAVTRPLTMRDKCICYIIALSMVCCDYKVNLKFLSLSASVHFTRVTRLARILGAVPITKDDTLFTLKLPLPALPKSSKAKIKRL